MKIDTSSNSDLLQQLNMFVDTTPALGLAYHIGIEWMMKSYNWHNGYQFGFLDIIWAWKILVYLRYHMGMDDQFLVLVS